MTHLAHIALIVRDYDEALAFYIGKLGFALVEDTPVPEEGKRWVTIRPPHAPDKATTILLARAATPDQHAAIGNQATGRLRCSPLPRNGCAPRSCSSQRKTSTATSPHTPKPASAS